MADIQTVSITIASAGVFLAAIYYILQIRHQAKTKAIDLVLRLDLVWQSKEFLESYAAVLDREIKEYDTYGIAKASKWIPESHVSDFFETLGFLLRKRLIDLDFAYTSFPTIYAWEKLKFWIEKIREQRHSQWFFQDFEYLYNEMKKREQRGVKHG